MSFLLPLEIETILISLRNLRRGSHNDTLGSLRKFHRYELICRGNVQRQEAAQRLIKWYIIRKAEQASGRVGSGQRALRGYH